MAIAVTRSQPVQKRSRDRVEKILLAAADQLARTGGADELTTTSVSKRSGVPVATIYRYFADRSAIIAALIDREMATLDASVAERLRNLDKVSIEALLDTITRSHFEYFRANRSAIVLWFGARKSNAVLDRIDIRYTNLGNWVLDSCHAAGLITDDAPDFGGEAIVWMCDRAFEFTFRVKRSKEEEDAIFNECLEMLLGQIGKYATARGRDGIALEEFLMATTPYGPGPSPEELAA